MGYERRDKSETLSVLNFLEIRDLAKQSFLATKETGMRKCLESSSYDILPWCFAKII